MSLVMIFNSAGHKQLPSFFCKGNSIVVISFRKTSKNEKCKTSMLILVYRDLSATCNVNPDIPALIAENDLHNIVILLYILGSYSCAWWSKSMEPSRNTSFWPYKYILDTRLLSGTKSSDLRCSFGSHLRTMWKVQGVYW